MTSRLIFFALGLLGFSCGSNSVLQEMQDLDNYPSASGVEFLNGHVYLIGDDANYLLVLDSSLAITDSLQLYDYPGHRIPKERKADLEAITVLPGKKLLLLGSGSVMPQRNRGWVIDPVTLQKDSIRLDSFYRRLLLYGIAEVNIEGVATIPGSIILANRGNKSNPRNQLIFTRENFWKNQAQAPINTVFMGFNSDSSSFGGVSGLGYARGSDKLFLTVSTEDTRNNQDDGAIGKSYLWIVKSISSKTRWKAINPDGIIDLVGVDPRFKGQKIESVCVMKETRKFIYLLLAADNDDGTSHLFRLAVPNN